MSFNSSQHYENLKSTDPEVSPYGTAPRLKWDIKSSILNSFLLTLLNTYNWHLHIIWVVFAQHKCVQTQDFPHFDFIFPA